MKLDLSHLSIGQVLLFLKISRARLYKDEGTVFPKLPKASSGRRWLDVYRLMEAYRRIWGEKPSTMYVKEWFYDLGLDKGDEADMLFIKEYLARLEARGLIR